MLLRLLVLASGYLLSQLSHLHLKNLLYVLRSIVVWLHV